MMDLKPLRVRIDQLDDQMLELLAERARIVSDVAAVKRDSNQPFYQPERERQIIERLKERSNGRFPEDAVIAVFREVMSACLALQKRLSVAFLGPQGSYSHLAARHLFGLAVDCHEGASLSGVVDMVRAKASDFGVVPIENSTEGGVTTTIDSLIEGGVSIRKEFVLEVSHSLMSHANDLTLVERIYSHPQALAQCRMWLARHVPQAQLVQTASTSLGARQAVDDPTGAALGSALAAEIYGLRVLARRVQDGEGNATRFLVIGHEDAPRSGVDKTTIVFSVSDGVGALHQVLGAMADNKVNMTRIESRPSKQRAWDYVFVADLEGHHDDGPVAAAIAVLKERCPLVRVLGSYPRHEGPALIP
ncbi:MAG: prephenate dehydratase [Clostridia bacterium]|nr:prephenate dehydratase [Deltaproteobacteria bacterium]